MRREGLRSGDKRARARSASPDPLPAPSVVPKRGRGHSVGPATNITPRTPRAAARAAAAAIKVLSSGGAAAAATPTSARNRAAGTRKRAGGAGVSTPRAAATATTPRVTRSSAAAAAAKAEMVSPKSAAAAAARTGPKGDEEEDEKKVVLRAFPPRPHPNPWLPYAIERRAEIEWAVSRDEMEELATRGKIMDKEDYAIGRIPFKVGLALGRSDPDDEDMEERQPLCVVVKCFDGIQSNVWEVSTTIKASIDGTRVFVREEGTYEYDSTQARLELPVSLADLMRHDSRYVNDQGAVPFRISIKVGRTMRVTRSVVFDVTRAHAHLADAVVVVEGAPLHVAASVLARHSMFFYEKFFGCNSEANRKMLKLDCTAEDFGSILHMMYLGENPALDDTRVLSLLYLAAQYAMPELMERCEDYLEAHIGTVLGSADLLLQVMALSDRYRLARVQAICIEFIFASGLIETVKQTEAYKRLSTDYKLLLLETQYGSQNQAKSAVKPEEPVIKEEIEEESETRPTVTVQ